MPHLFTLPAYLLPDAEMLDLAALAVAGQVDPGPLAAVLGCDAAYVPGWAAALADAYYGEPASTVAALALPRRVADLTAPEAIRLFTVPGITNPTRLRAACCRLLSAVAPLPARPALHAAK